MTFTNGEVLRFYVFIESKEGITGVEITDGRVDIENETEPVSDGVMVNHVPTGTRYITLTGKMGATKHVSHMPDEANIQELLIEKEGEK